jgi:hypothetical protein
MEKLMVEHACFLNGLSLPCAGGPCSSTNAIRVGSCWLACRPLAPLSAAGRLCLPHGSGPSGQRPSAAALLSGTALRMGMPGGRQGLSMGTACHACGSTCLICLQAQTLQLRQMRVGPQHVHDAQAVPR